MSDSSGELPINDWPEDLAPTDMSFDLLSMSAIYRDPRSGRTLRQHRAPDLWVASMTFRNLMPDKWRKLAGFMALIHGPVGRVRLFDFSPQCGNRGQAYDLGAPPIVLAATAPTGSTSVTVELDGYYDGTVFKMGDVFMLPDDRLCMVTEDTAENSLGSGGSTVVNFEPPLMQTVNDDQPVTVYRPTGIFYLASRPQLPRSIDGLVSVDLNFVEEIRPEI